MRIGARAVMWTALVGVLCPAPGISQDRAIRREPERGLCRRAAPMPPLAPEPPERRFDPRQAERAPSAYATRGEALPPPPPAPSPPPPPVAMSAASAPNADASASRARVEAEPARAPPPSRRATASGRARAPGC